MEAGGRKAAARRTLELDLMNVPEIWNNAIFRLEVKLRDKPPNKHEEIFNASVVL